MELETVVLEAYDDMDLGEAGKAYRDYPQSSQRYEEQKTAYKALVVKLASKDPLSITREEKQEADALSEEILILRKECAKLADILSGKLEELVLIAKERERDLAYHEWDLKDEESIRWGRSLLEEVQGLRQVGNLMEAVSRAYRARVCLEGLLERAKQAWIKRHQEQLEELGSEEEN
jgi:hypothetical protein